MKFLRTLHMYLSCACAPLLVFFIISGSWQALGLHVAKKNARQPPQVLQRLSEIHMQGGKTEPKSSVPFRLLVLAMALGFLATTALGVVMAFRFARQPKLVWLCLASGLLVPIAVVLLERGLR